MAERSRRRRWQGAAALVVLAAVVAVAVTWWRSPGQRLERVAGDLRDLPGVASAEAADHIGEETSPDLVRVRLEEEASYDQVGAVLRAAAAETEAEPRPRTFEVTAGDVVTRLRAEALFGDPVPPEALAAHLVALRDLENGTAVVFDDGGVMLAGSDGDGAAAADLVGEALALLDDKGLPLPPSVRTADEVVNLRDLDATPAQAGAVLAALGLREDWDVATHDPDELYVDVSPGSTQAEVTRLTRAVGRALAEVTTAEGLPVVQRVQLSSRVDTEAGFVYDSVELR